MPLMPSHAQPHAQAYMREAQRDMDGPKRRLERLACDRCHRQKLRCSRSSHGRACQRCVKAGERCTYSPPLRLGRPASGSRPGDQDRQRPLSPPTPMTTPPTMALAALPLDALDSGPPTPPVCLDGLEACTGRWPPPPLEADGAAGAKTAPISPSSSLPPGG